MAIVLWQPGRRLFSVAAVLMILTAAAHTAGNLASGPAGPAEQTAFAVMSHIRAPLGMGMSPSLQDIYWTLVFTMSITLAALGLLNLLLAASPDTPPRLLRRLTWANVVWVGAFLALCWFYQVPPPLLSAVIIETTLLASLFVPAGQPAKPRQPPD